MSSISKGLTEAFDLAAMQQEYRTRKAEILKNADMYSKKYDIPTDAKHFAEKVMSKQEHESNVEKSNAAREKAKKEYEANQAKQLEHDKENIDLLKAKLAKLQSSFDPNYEYSDDHTFWSTQKDIASKISSLKKRISNVEGEKLDELSTEKLAQYKTLAAADAGKADKEGDYKRGDKRFSGIVKATKKQFANDTKTVKENMQTVYKEAKSLLTQLDESTQQQVINHLKESIVNEFEGDIETITAPTSNNQPSHGFAIKVHGPLGLRQGGISATSLWYGLSAVFPNKYPRKDYQNYGAQMSSPQAQVLNQINRKGSAIVADGLASRDIAETLANKLGRYDPGIEHHKPIGTNHVEVIEQGMDEATEKPADAFKNVYPRVNNPKILGTQNRAKSIYYPPSKPNVKKLDKPLPESLGDELKSKSLQALQQVKQQIEQQRIADLEQWEKDFKQNTVAKFTARQPSFMQQQPKQVAKPLEKHSVLKARLVQLNKAIEKQAILDKMLQRLDNKGLLTPAIQSDTDTSMLVRDGASDNYVSLNQKLDKALEFVKNRLLTNKAAFAKPKAIDENEELEENLHQWFKEKWVRFGPDGKIRGACARGDDSEGKPKCLPQAKAHALGKKGRASAAARKRREDPNPERSGKAINVNTKKKSNESVAEGVNDYLWHGSKSEHKILYPQQANDTGGKEESNKNAVYATPSAKTAIAMGLTTPGSDTGMFPNDPQMVLFSGNIRKGQMVYLHKVPKDLFIKHNSREWYSKPGVQAIKPIEVVKVPVDQWLHLIRQATPQDLELRKKYMKQGVAEAELDEACWKGYHKEGNKKMFGKTYPNCVKNEGVAEGSEAQDNLVSILNSFDYYSDNGKVYVNDAGDKIARQGSNWKHQSGKVGHGSEELGNFLSSKKGVAEEHHSESCPHCGGEMVSEELMNEKKDACYYKVKSRYKVWPSAYASGALVKCRKKGASNWGNGGKSNESVDEAYPGHIEKGKELDAATKKIQANLDRRIRGHDLDAATKEIQKNLDKRIKKVDKGVKEDQLDEKWSKKYKDSINCSNPKGFSQKAHCASKKKNESSILQGLNQLDEGWKEKLGAAALAGSMALGAGAAHSRVTPDGQGGFTGGLKPTATVTAPSDNKPAAEAPKGFSKEYLQKAADPNRTGRYMISVEKAQELLKNMP